MMKWIYVVAFAVFANAVEAQQLLNYSSKPIWVSGSKNCGGDGNARLLDFDQDGDLDVVTSLPNPSRWVVFENKDGRLGEKPAWESKATTDKHQAAVDDDDSQCDDDEEPQPPPVLDITV